MNIVIFFSGTGTNLESILKLQNDYKYKVIGAFTNNPKARGIQICKRYNSDCKIIDHEKVHLDQMARGDLDYDDNYVYWKGDKILRSKINEGAEELPWEKEAYNKTK